MSSGRVKIAGLYAAIVLAQGADHNAAMRDAIAAMQRGDFQSAERQLRVEVAAHPDDALALSLLGAALDNLKKFPEAAGFHSRAVAKAPRSTDVLTSYAAHLWIAGNAEEARHVYLRVVALDASNSIANLQLARLALKKRNGADALRYLDRLPANQRENPPAHLLRLEALYLSGENALNAYPSNFKVLYDLGVAATYAGHYDRAREVLDAALRRQPRNVDVLYALARADEGLKQWETAVRWLAQAAKLDPRRADVQEMLAVTTTKLGALDDAVAAWDRYLKLEPNNENARRERSYTLAQMGQLEQGIAGLEWFIARHPEDVLGHYELGQAERNHDMAKAFLHFDKALELDPNYAPARTARGSLYYQEGNPAAAVKDLEAAARVRPDDAAGLDRLGQAYQALDRTADAVRVLRQAAELAPGDSKALLHFARALADVGKTEEAKAVMDRFRELGPEKQRSLPAGFVEFLNLTDEQRHADYRARVEKEVRNHPNDAAAQVAWMKLLIEDANWDRVPESARAIAGLKPGVAVLADAGRALLVAKQYGLAREVLKQAAAPAASSDIQPAAGIQLDLAIAVFSGGDAAQALQEMDGIPERARGGDYYLAHAQMLSALSQTEEARAAIDRALRSAPPRADFYLQATAFLTQNNQTPEALRFLDQGARLLPGNREILLLKAGTLELAGQPDDAGHLLSDIRSRWPEWYPAWVVYGIVLKTHNHPDEARRARETAAALGAPADMLSLDLKSILERTLLR
jgi:tetratricopeptide (TPR) repeat protein